MERLQRKLEALRRLNLDRVCSLVTEEAREEATEETKSSSTTISTVEQAITQAVTSDTKFVSPVERPELIKTSNPAVLPLQGIGGGAQCVQHAVSGYTTNLSLHPSHSHYVKGWTLLD